MSDGGKNLILVADDDTDVRELLVFRLDRAGYEVITAGDGEEALRLSLDRRPDVCVIDVMMPKIDGYELAQQLRASDELAGVSILLLTASVEDAAVERGFAAGADDYIKKPFSPAELVDRISTVLERR